MSKCKIIWRRSRFGWSAFVNQNQTILPEVTRARAPSARDKSKAMRRLCGNKGEKLAYRPLKDREEPRVGERILTRSGEFATVRRIEPYVHGLVAKGGHVIDDSGRRLHPGDIRVKRR